MEIEGYSFKPGWVVAAVVDADDFVVQARERGPDWATKTIVTITSIIAGVMHAYGAMGWRHEPPDEWVLRFAGDSYQDARHAAITCARRIQQDIAQDADVTVSVGVSLPQKDQDSFSHAEHLARATTQRKLVQGGDRVIEQVEGEPTSSVPPRIDRALARLVHRGDRIGAARLIADWIDRCARLPGVEPSQLHEWMIGQILSVMDMVSPHRTPSGSADWMINRGGVQLSDLVRVTEIHELSYLHVWAAETLNQLIKWDNQTAAGEVLLKSAERYITEYYADQTMQLDTVAQAISVSPYHLARLFRKLRDTTFLHYLTGVRMMAARQLLVSTNLSIELIGRDTGYASAKRFRTVFKREMGCAPSEYRRNHGGDPGPGLRRPHRPLSEI